jgi:hypothetical protein
LEQGCAPRGTRHPAHSTAEPAAAPCTPHNTPRNTAEALPSHNPPLSTVCDSCPAEETDCPFLGRVYVNSSEPDPVGYCKAQCESQGNLNCNAINVGEDGKGNMDCVFRSCNDIPPATDPIDPSKCPGCTYAVYSFWNGVVITYDIAKQVWGRVPINQTACPDPNQPPAPLTPRDSGYTLGVVRRSGGDRLLLLGGDSDECVPSPPPRSTHFGENGAPLTHTHLHPIPSPGTTCTSRMIAGAHLC